MSSRRDRLRAIRARLAELLASGELVTRERPYSRPGDVSLHVATLLNLADGLETWTEEQKQGPQYREAAGFVASELEGLAAWLAEGDRA